MVTAVSSPPFNALEYLTQLRSVSQPAPVTPPPVTDETDGPGASTPPNTFPPTPSLASVLGIPSDVLSLLQNVDSSSSNGGLVSTLTGGVGNSNPLSGVYNSLLQGSSSVAPLQHAINAAQQQQNQTQAQTSSVQAIVNSHNNASNAYNKVLQQNAQAALAANAYGPDGKTPLVA